METPRASFFSMPDGMPGTPTTGNPTGRLRLISLTAPPWVRDMLSPGRKGQFRIVKALAITSTGNVQLVSYQEPDGTTHLGALKQYFKGRLNPVRVQQIHREARIHSQMCHPNILPFWAAWEDSNYYNLLMKYEAGGNLHEHLGKDRILPEHKAVERVIQPLLSAISYLHDRRFIHRDIKLENVLVGKDRIALMDFGLSSSIDEAASDSVGTLNYMSMEVLSGGPRKNPDEPASPVPNPYCGMSADIWALGVLTYELIVGHLPFPGKSMREVQEAIRRGLSLPDHLSSEASDFLRCVLCPDPDDRPTAYDLLTHSWILAHSSGNPDGVRRPIASEFRVGGRTKRVSSSIDFRAVNNGSPVVGVPEGKSGSHLLPPKQRPGPGTSNLSRNDAQGTSAFASSSYSQGSGVTMFGPTVHSMTPGLATGLQKQFIMSNAGAGGSRGAKSVIAARLPALSSGPCESSGVSETELSADGDEPEEKRSARFLKALGKLFRRRPRSDRPKKGSGSSSESKRASSKGGLAQAPEAPAPPKAPGMQTPAQLHTAQGHEADATTAGLRAAVRPLVLSSLKKASSTPQRPSDPSAQGHGWGTNMDTSQLFSPPPPPPIAVFQPIFERSLPLSDERGQGAGALPPNRDVVYQLGPGAALATRADSNIEREEAKDTLGSMPISRIAALGTANPYSAPSTFSSGAGGSSAGGSKELRNHGSPLSMNDSTSGSSLSGRSLPSVATDRGGPQGGGSVHSASSLYKDSFIGQAKSTPKAGKSPTTQGRPEDQLGPMFASLGVPEDH